MGKAILIYLAAVNLWAFAIWGIDKWKARRGARRIRERTLLFAALVAGAPGAWLGVRIFRHKSSKRSFLWKLALVTAVNGVWIWLWVELR